MLPNRSLHPLVLLTTRAGARLAGLIGGRKYTTLCGRLVALCLALICATALAEAQPCPSTFSGWVNVGTGSCAVPGLGTISNVRFSTSGANGGVVPTMAELSIFAGAAAVLGPEEGFLFVPGSEWIVESLQLPGLVVVGPAGSTSTLNFAYKLTPEAGFTITGAGDIVGGGFYGFQGEAGSVGCSLSLCLNGNFTGFPPVSCSGTTVNVNAPTLNSFSGVSPAASATFSATSMDVFVSAVGSGIADGFFPEQGFTLSGQSSQPLPTISSVVNAATWIPPALPNGGIAQGGIFVVSGSNLGPAAISVASTPFQSTNLAGTSVYVTVGDQMVEAPMYYSLAGYVAALLPSNTPVGAGTVVVTYNGLTSSNAFPVTVVENNLGIFTASQNGQGAAIVTYNPDYSLVSPTKAANCGGPLTPCGAANPGDILTLWATGLGPVNGSDAAGAGLGVNMTSIPLTLWMGGVQAQVSYQGRSGYIGEDQINFKVPPNVPTGCAVPLTVQIGSETSNSTTIAVANGSRTCTPTNPAITPSVMQPSAAVRR